MFKISYQVFVLIAAQCENICSRLAKDHREEDRRSPRQRQLFFKQSEPSPVKVTVCVVQMFTETHKEKVTEGQKKKWLSNYWFIKINAHEEQASYLQIIEWVVTCADSEQ